MQDRPDSFRFALNYGKVIAVHPESWECDVLLEEGGATQRAIVLGSRLPEVSTPTRPQFVVVGCAAHLQGQPVCWPVESRLTNNRSDFIYYDEPCAVQRNGSVLGYRVTVDRSGNLEIRSLTDPLRRIRIVEQDGKIELTTPTTQLILKDSDKSVTVHCDETLTATCRNAHVTAEQNASLKAGGTVDVEAGGDASVTAVGNLSLRAPVISLEGSVTIEGNVSLQGNLLSTGSVIDASGNTSHHTHG